MRLTAAVALTLLTQSQGLTPTALEAFAARPAAKVVWSKAVGQLEGPEARITLTAIALEDASSTPSLMRGLRIDLIHLDASPACDQIYSEWAILCARPNAAIFLDEDQLARAHATMTERGTASVHPGEWGGITHFRRGGSVKPSGLIVVGYTLDDRQPEELAALFEQGLAALKDAPR